MKKFNQFSYKDKEKDHHCVFKHKKVYLNSVVLYLKYCTFYRFQIFPIYRVYTLIFPIQRAPPPFP